MKDKGLLVVISAPSGGGKTTIIRRVLETGDADFKYSVSVTTRPRRPDEVDGRDYFFWDLETFERKREQGEFIEWAEVHGDFYATPRSHLEQWLQEGKTVLLDLDVHGGLEIKRLYGPSALLIFIKPPSLGSLVERLKSRNTEDTQQIGRRLQRFPEEMQKAASYNFQILNEDLSATVAQVLKIIEQRKKN
ncbi:MAG: guanylate kinase [bacterium]